MRLIYGARSAIVGKARSPFLTQVAQSLANNKHTSRALLRARGLPCAEDVLFDEALLRRHGRLVVKPNWGKHTLMGAIA